MRTQVGRRQRTLVEGQRYHLLWSAGRLTSHLKEAQRGLRFRTERASILRGATCRSASLRLSVRRGLPRIAPFRAGRLYSAQKSSNLATELESEALLGIIEVQVGHVESANRSS